MGGGRALAVRTGCVRRRRQSRRLSRLLVTVALPLVLALGLSSPGLLGGGEALAASCPNATAPTVVAASSAGPGYRFIRGCIASFDGTSIVYDLYEPLAASASHPVNALLEQPGWSGWGPYASDCALSTSGVGLDPPVALSGGYAFLTWDPRGFGQSGGASQVDSPLAEGRDVSALIDQVLRGRAEIAVDHNRHDKTYGQPAVGMMGGSYGGGIQFAAAAFDPRIKAIVPQWAWNDLDYSLFPGGVPKQTWFELLFGEGAALSTASHYTHLESCSHTAGTQLTAIYDPNLERAWAQVTSTGYPDAQTLAWFAQRSMAVFGAGSAGHVPDVPTLMIQGTTDTLFNLNEAWANYQMIKARHPAVPVKLIGFCGGHAGCQYSSTPPSGFEAGVPDATFIDQQEINWFNVYLRHDRGAADTLPTVVLQDQTGVWHTLDSFPTRSAPGAAAYTSTPFSGTLVSTGVPSDWGNPFNLDEYAAPSNAHDPGALSVPILTAPAAGNPNLPPQPQHVALNLVGVGYRLPPGDTLALQISSASAPSASDRGAALTTLSGSVELPTLAPG